MKGFCPRTISTLGSTGQSCPGWALAPSEHSAAALSSLPGSAPSSTGFCQELLQPWISGSLATPLQALREPGAMPRGREPCAPPSLCEGGDIHAATLTGAVDPVSLQPNSAGFVPGICELYRGRAMPRVSTARRGLRAQ